jgi:hypothetical protein
MVIVAFTMLCAASQSMTVRCSDIDFQERGSRTMLVISSSVVNDSGADVMGTSQATVGGCDWNTASSIASAIANAPRDGWSRAFVFVDGGVAYRRAKGERPFAFNLIKVRSGQQASLQWVADVQLSTEPRWVVVLLVHPRGVSACIARHKGKSA